MGIIVNTGGRGSEDIPAPTQSPAKENQKSNQRQSQNEAEQPNH